MSQSTDAGTEDLIGIDFVEGLFIADHDFLNEATSLRILGVGLKQLYDQIKALETCQPACATEFLWQWGGVPGGVDWKTLSHVMCVFHWFGTSLINYARLVGFISGIAKGDFSRSDLYRPPTHKVVKSSVDSYVERVEELKNVLIWRNKVFAHFAATAPHREDNIATLEISVLFPVTFEHSRFFVGGVSLHKKAQGSKACSDLPKWSLTGVFEGLSARYWPTFGLATAPLPRDA